VSGDEVAVGEGVLVGLADVPPVLGMMCRT